ncbi:hypothetical protein SELMODRAFT_415668 [Selaginella moellendorffii]|uniref:Uncharacterized protein n=1 Tax=Selaginella moellendorffii TaxID=88036 RepID=D8RWV4_SELML|nr:hypothetical protein SELMODRAFT_415668 [Selaginella moellendorffii]
MNQRFLRMEVSSLHSEHVAAAAGIGRDPQRTHATYSSIFLVEKLDPVWWFSPLEAPSIGAFRTRERNANLRKRFSTSPSSFKARTSNCCYRTFGFFMVLRSDCELCKLAV